jgi:hypothetical protein
MLLLCHSFPPFARVVAGFVSFCNAGHNADAEDKEKGDTAADNDDDDLLDEEEDGLRDDDAAAVDSVSSLVQSDPQQATEEDGGGDPSTIPLLKALMPRIVNPSRFVPPFFKYCSTASRRIMPPTLRDISLRMVVLVV